MGDLPKAPAKRQGVPQEFQCASEVALNSTCVCDGYVKYGAGALWTEWLNASDLGGSVDCNSDVFGDPLPGKAKVCMCQPQAFTCATEWPVPTAGCVECLMESTCMCEGLVRFGYGERWTDWRKSPGSVPCRTDTFGDPYEGHGKLCQCKPLDFMLNTASATTSNYAPVGKIMSATIIVTLAYFVVYAGLAISRSFTQVNGMIPGATERVILSGTAAVYLAPMLVALFFAATKRAETLTLGSPGYYDYPPAYLGVAAMVCAIAFCCQVFFHLAYEWITAPEYAAADRGTGGGWRTPGSAGQLLIPSQSSSRSVDLLKLWVNLFHVAVAVMFFGLMIMLTGISLMQEPKELVQAAGKIPIAAGTVCTVVLSVAYFTVYLVLHCLKTRDIAISLSSPSFGVEVMRLAATAMNFAPMLCILFMGTQIAADWEGVQLTPAVMGCIYICTFSVLVQVVLVLLAPLMPDAELEVTGARGEVDFVTRNRGAFIVISFVRWAAMTALYVGVLVLCFRLWSLRVAPAMTHMLVRLSGIYFMAYLMLWVTITGRVLLDGGLTRAIRILTVVKDTVAFCPMLAALVLQSFVRARHLMNKYGEIGTPQGYVQDYMHVALIALCVQLMTTLISGVVSRSPVTATPSTEMEEKLDEHMPTFLAVFHIAMTVFYASVLVVVCGVFTITTENASGRSAWIF